jgi:mannose-1-phosphate guanylyltransferase
MHDKRWGIVLAGGEGNRVKDFLSALCGGRGIKQFCSIFGGRSLLQMTLDRVQRLIPRERILIIVDKRHPEAREQLAGWPHENIIYQPANRETAPGILLPLAYVSHRCPEALLRCFRRIILLPTSMPLSGTSPKPTSCREARFFWA